MGLATLQIHKLHNVLTPADSKARLHFTKLDLSGTDPQEVFENYGESDYGDYGESDYGELADAIKKEFSLIFYSTSM